MFKFLSRVHPKFKTPVNATLMSGITFGLMAAVFNLDVLMDFMSIGTLLAYTMVSACVIILRYKQVHSTEHNDPLRRKVPLNLFPDWRGRFVCKGEKNWDCRGKSELPHTSVGGLDIFRADFGNRFWTPKVQLFQPPPRQMWLPQPLFSLVKTALCLKSNLFNKFLTTVGIDSFVLCAILANYRRDLGIMLVKKNMITNSQHTDWSNILLDSYPLSSDPLIGGTNTHH